MRTVEDRVQTASAASRGRTAGKGAIHLFGWELRRTRLSYLAAALFGAVSGAIAGVLLDGVFVLEGFGEAGRSLERGFNTGVTDMWFLATTPVFLINFAFNEFYANRFTQDNFSRWMRFLRELPISAGSIVASRAISAALAIGIYGFVLWMLAAARRLARREL